MKILVTGSSGTIGTELIDQLKEQGHYVFGIDKVEPQKHNCDVFLKHDLVTYPTFVHGPFDMLIHLAANARVHNSVVDPGLALENIETTHTAYELARLHKIPKFIMASSRETYGEATGDQLKMLLPTPEHHASQRNSLSPYTAGKIMGEAYGYAYANCYDVDVRIVRFSNVYGRYDTSDRFIPKIIQKMLKDEPFEVWGREKVLDFTYIEDAAAGILTMIDKWEQVPLEMNLAYGEGTLLVDVAEFVKKELNSKSEIIVTDSLVGEVTSYVADISKAKEIGWQPATNIWDGIRYSIDYYKDLFTNNIEYGS